MKVKMKKLMYVLAIVVLAVLVQSCEGPNLDQRSYVSGIVRDASTGEPIVGAEVYLSRHTPVERIAPRAAEPVGPSMTLTDSLGKYEFTHLYFGTYNISAVADGYLPSDNIEITLMEEAEVVNFELVKGE
jgi:hypothetical protein